MRPLFAIVPLLLTTACSWLTGSTPPGPVRDTVPAHRPPSQPVVVRDTQLEQRVARLELRVLEKEAQVE